MLELTITLIISSILFLLLSFFTFSLPKMEGYSMMTTLEDRDRLFVNKLGAVKRFSLVYYKDPVSGAKSIRRIIGLPFESLYYKNDQLFINDTETVERFIDKQLTTSKNSNSTFTKDFSLNEVLGNLQVPKGKYFVLGDNRSYATDSRTFGYIDEKDIIGVIELRIFPLHRMTHF
nr:signal peptidase I [Enterococcus sp. 7F3_DIV0205]